MKKSLFILLFSLLTAIGMKADLTADWTMHMPFDAWPTQVVETPGRVYFTSRTFENEPNIPGRDFSSLSLFYYDKEGDEIVSVNERSNASGNAVACIGYNAGKKYLLVVYTDSDIDFIYDDGRVFNLPALKVTSIPGRKESNGINFDNSRNLAYVATSFGYLALNDEKHEVYESRNYGTDIKSIARCGDNIVIAMDGKLYYAPASQQRFNLEDYIPVEGDLPEIDGIIPTDTERFFAYRKGPATYLLDIDLSTPGNTWKKLYDDSRILCVQQTAGGHILAGDSKLYNIPSNGDNPSTISRPSPDNGNPASSLTGNELWALASRKGLRGYKRNGADWTVTRDYMRPNAPATYMSTAIQYHPTFGMLVGSNGYDLALNDFNQQTPNNISALKGGFWKEYGPNYASSVGLASTNNYTGLSIDPQNPNHVYRSSTLGGIMRINLANPSDVTVFANPSNFNAGSAGFVKITDDQQAWNVLCRFTPPRFTPDGTLWSLYYNRNKERAELWYWPASDRLASTNAATYRPMKVIPLPVSFHAGNSDVMTTLSKNKNIFAIGGFAEGGTFMLYDHNGTPENTNDDRYVHFTNAFDQDGGSVNFLSVNDLYEDPATGLLWILSQRGVFTVNPVTAFEEPNRVNRIKVARNDGTNLADYLLNEINVHSMSVDGEGRKWFATSNGLVCTSADGRTILGEFTTENSYLPSNTIYATCYNPENNSMMVATDGGLVEMFPSGSGGSTAAGAPEMRAYPNPVEPDFYGWVRIDNIADGSLVKITDSKGGLVKELGPAQSGSVEWDVSGLNNSRVSTGVYYIMVSPGSGGDGKTQIGKILVLN